MFQSQCVVLSLNRLLEQMYMYCFKDRRYLKVLSAGYAKFDVTHVIMILKLS